MCYRHTHITKKKGEEGSVHSKEGEFYALPFVLDLTRLWEIVMRDGSSQHQRGAISRLCCLQEKKIVRARRREREAKKWNGRRRL